MTDQPPDDQPPVVNNVVLMPSCDLHMTVNQAPALALRVVRQKTHPTAGEKSYLLTTVPPSQCTIDWFRPYDTPGTRLADTPTLMPGDGVNTTFVITDARPGIYLFQLRIGVQFQVGRLQVHREVKSWWFGNDSITTAVHRFAHAQPSIYAKFSDDDTGVDLVGDITGHGFVTLTPSDPATFTVSADGRLRGLKTTDPAHLPNVAGSWPQLGTVKNTPATIPVRVVDYTVPRTLETVRGGDVAGFRDKHNILFLGEGFRQKDKDRFDRMVQQTTDEMFTKPRHEPYPLLAKSFNVFKAFTPSEQHTVTCGFTVKDTASANIAKGTPLPLEKSVNPGTYRLNDLIGLVGLPRRNEPAGVREIRDQWTAQGLPGPDRNRDLILALTDDALISEWREHRADGILHARDTFFGLHTGARWGDRVSLDSFDPVTGELKPLTRPTADVPGSPEMREFIRRLYQFSTPQVPGIVAVTLDRRRHPPELFSFVNQTNPNNTLTQFLGTLGLPTLPIGAEWVPDDDAFQRSRGLVVMLVLDDHEMGQNINRRSLTALSADKKPTLPFEFRNLNPQQTEHREMRRTPADTITLDMNEIIDTVAHELGHSFNLDDEYELFGGPDPAVRAADKDLDADNVTHFNFINAHDPAFPNHIDAARVKWLAAPRMSLSSRLTGPSQVVDGGLRIPIDPADAGSWTRARTKTPGLQAALRSITYVKPPTRQLPQTGLLLSPLTIVEVRADAVVVAGPGIPPASPIPAGSVLWVPLREKDGGPELTVVEPKVAEFLLASHEPLNSSPVTDVINEHNDDPKSIKDFKAPCKSFRVVGLYEGAKRYAAHHYRPTGGCKMRDSRDTSKHGGEFCFVCKWLIVNRVDPGMHAALTSKFYPNKK